MKRLVSTSLTATPDEPHYAGKCCLNASKWPKDGDGGAMLHVATFPCKWFNKNSNLWASLFMQYKGSDPYFHWEILTPGEANTSVIVVHDNKSEPINLFEPLKTEEVLIEEIVTDEIDASEKFESKISDHIAWLQDEDKVDDCKCLAMINGDDFDNAFGGDVGLFSDGYVYLFFYENETFLESNDNAGKITFQFS